MKFIYSFSLFICLCTQSFSQDGDSAHSENSVFTVKRYIKPSIYHTSYFTPESNSTESLVKIAEYSFYQSNSGFYLPVLTLKRILKDSISKEIIHILFTSNFSNSILSYSSALDNRYSYHSYKVNSGPRFIWQRNKNVLLATFTPFISQESNFVLKPTIRLAGSMIYSYSFSRKFSVRAGFTSTYLFTVNRLIPLIGFRIGPLDGIHLSLTVPRSATLYVPMGNKVSGSIFIKPNGSIFNYQNTDSLQGKINSEIVFARYDLMYGFNINYRFNDKIAVSLSSGFSGYRYLYWTNNSDFKRNSNAILNTTMRPTLFVNVGIAIRFGKSKSIYNNVPMYDMLDLNLQFDPSDQNTTIPNGDIPNRYRSNSIDRIKNIQYRDVQDIIQEEL